MFSLKGVPRPIGQDRRCSALRPYACRETICDVCFQAVRLEESRNRNTGGVGLGLAIARKVAEAHGGSLTLAEAPSGGTRAIVELPLFRRGNEPP